MLMLHAKLCQPAHGNPILLVNPRELQPELALGDRRGGIPAGKEHSQGGIAMIRQLLHCILQGAELIQCSARKQFHVLKQLNLHAAAMTRIQRWSLRVPRLLRNTVATRFAIRLLHAV
jgi:hypothetical protein